MNDIILQTENLSKFYKNVPAVDGVNLTIRKGDIYGFIGKNGAGKTTLMRIVSGLIAKHEGSFVLLGMSSNDSKGILTARSRICSIIEQPALYMSMNAVDNLKQQCLICGKDYSRVDELLSLVELLGVGGKKAKDYSLGMKQRLGIAMAMVTEPEFMLLDEPTNGLDPMGIQKIREILQKLNRERGVTIMISSHILGELKLLATRYGFIHCGRLIDEVSATDLEQKSRPATELHVSDAGRAVLLLKGLGLDCTINGGKVMVLGDFDLTTAVVALKEGGVNLHNVVTGTYDLEKYFMDLISRSPREGVFSW